MSPTACSWQMIGAATKDPAPSRIPTARRVGAHILDEDSHPAPQHLCFAQTRPQRIGRGPVSVGWIHALRDQRATLEAEDGRALEPGALAERPGGAGEEHLDGGRAAQAPERLAHPQQRRAGRRRGARGVSPRAISGASVRPSRCSAWRRDRVWHGWRTPRPWRRRRRTPRATLRTPDRASDQACAWPRGRSQRRLASLHTTASSRASASPTTAASQGDGPVEESGLARSGWASGRVRAGGRSVTLSARLLRAGDLRSSFALRSLLRSATSRPMVCGPTTPSTARACAS